MCIVNDVNDLFYDSYMQLAVNSRYMISVYYSIFVLGWAVTNYTKL